MDDSLFFEMIVRASPMVGLAILALCFLDRSYKQILRENERVADMVFRTRERDIAEMRQAQSKPMPPPSPKTVHCRYCGTERDSGNCKACGAP